MPHLVYPTFHGVFVSHSSHRDRGQQLSLPASCGLVMLRRVRRCPRSNVYRRVRGRAAAVVTGAVTVATDFGLDQATAVPQQDLHPVTAFGPKNQHGPRKRILAENRRRQCRQAVRRAGNQRSSRRQRPAAGTVIKPPTSTTKGATPVRSSASVPEQPAPSSGNPDLDRRCGRGANRG